MKRQFSELDVTFCCFLNPSCHLVDHWISWCIALKVLEKSLNFIRPDMCEPWHIWNWTTCWLATDLQSRVALIGWLPSGKLNMILKIHFFSCRIYFKNSVVSNWRLRGRSRWSSNCGRPNRIILRQNQTSTPRRSLHHYWRNRKLTSLEPVVVPWVMWLGICFPTKRCGNKTIN